LLLRIITKSLIILTATLLLHTQAHAEACDKAVPALNARLSPKIDEQELVDILRTLNSTNNKKLPAKYVTKKEARSLGWKPGRDLWSSSSLRGSSIGGDHFSNRERRLPGKKWREADLDYKGGRRGSKRLVFSREGKRYVTVDHYNTFVEVPSCR
jgi:hypothetical protein